MEISRRRLLAALALTPWLSALPLRAALPEQQRIIALEWLPTELLLALGVAPLAVADTRNYNIWVGEPPLPPQTVDVGLRTEPNLELMTQLHPSLILCSNGYGPPPEKLKRIAPIMGFDLNRGDGKPLSAARDSLRALATRVDVIGVVALDHPLIRHAIQAVSRQGVRVYALFSDFSPCGQAGYIGVDNQKAGRTAAWMAQHLLRRPGSVGVLLGDHHFTCQESCEISFRSGMREYGATQRVLEPLNTRESVEGGYRAAQALLDGHADLQLIYAPCGGIEGVVRALREQAQRRVMLVCHGPAQEGELALIDGSITLMLRHNIETMAAAVVRLCTERQSERDARYEQVILPFEIITRENM